MGNKPGYKNDRGQVEVGCVCVCMWDGGGIGVLHRFLQ